MTVSELYARALNWHPKLRDGRFSRFAFKRWLDKMVDSGWLELDDRRYYLTDKGYEIAAELDRTVA